VAPTIEEDIDNIHKVASQGDEEGRHQQGEEEDDTNKENQKTPNNNQEETCGKMEKTLRGRRSQEVGEVSPWWLNTPRRTFLEGSQPLNNLNKKKSQKTSYQNLA
jgi:hypothetical protein